jgi:nitrite reductase (NADH) small subunit
MTTTSEVRRDPGGCAPRNATGSGWLRVCPADRLLPGRGVAALLEGRQVALFRLPGDPEPELHALDNVDPFSGAAVLSRGIVGDRGGEPVVASPVYKQAFSLRSGRCLDDPEQRVAVHRARIVDGWVQVELT